MEDPVNHPSHYTTGFESRRIECIDITRHMTFDIGNAFKYVWRSGKKGDQSKAEEDLFKALWYIEDAEEMHLTRPGSPMWEAHMMFELISPENSQRYHALRALVHGDLNEARNIISTMIEELENGNTVLENL